MACPRYGYIFAWTCPLGWSEVPWAMVVSQCFERIHFQFWQSTFLCWEVLTHKAIAVVMMVNTNGSITITLENHNHCHHVSLLIYCITAHLFFSLKFFKYVYTNIYNIYLHTSIIIDLVSGCNPRRKKQNISQSKLSSITCLGPC
jgi:hypothetical protein